jgi:oxygen-independent coproporphyrinogen-3 oxidase
MQSPRSVYVHIPFCRHRCGYCNFTLMAGRNDMVSDYLQALQRALSQVESRPVVDTVYLGGGTPSRLSAASLARLLDLLEQHFQLASDYEFTLEANPEDLPGEIAGLIAASPVNRISLGVQSFHVDKLRSLDRQHDANTLATALQCVSQICQTFSIDLIFAAPFDSPDIWQADLQQGIDCGADHISTYELTWEKGTRFWNQLNRGSLQAAPDEQCAEYYEQTIRTLTGHGFQHYEISSFARPGYRSRHNQVYWSGASFLAFGPGASGFTGSVRYTNHRSVSRYLKKVLAGESAVEESQMISQRELAIDRLVFGLRLIEGVDLQHFRQQTGMAITDLVPSDVLGQLVENRLIELLPDRLRLTTAGLLLGDEVCSRIISSADD